MNAERQFRRAGARAAADAARQDFLRAGLAGYGHAAAGARRRFADWSAARDRCQEVKAEALAHLDAYLLRFEERVVARGGHVFWAETAAAARDYILGVARRHGARRVIKSKSMVSEEVRLTPALEAAGIATVETDLGEFIVQLRREPPFHIVTPAMHLRRGEIAALFQRELGAPPGADSAEELAGAARRALRDQFLAAEMGITGANFLIAEEGLVAITENEGNARLCSSLPRVHVVLTGLEKVLPRLADLGLFWPVLAAAGTGQPITCYNSLIGGPRQPEERDGPEEFHVVLLDNGRSALLADRERRDTLACIRCGACLNVCPVFHTIGGHAYGATYSGPIGAVLMPQLGGLERFGHLAFASSLCGACTEACPVKIDLHRHLIRNRRDAVAAGRGRRREGWAVRAWAWLAADPRRYQRAGAVLRRLLRVRRVLPGEGGMLDPLRPWTRARALPAPPAESFREWWRRRTAAPPARDSHD
ncbi:MAG TPA: LutB/LldF family L-lactate oxidation iron-sulfur protein [Terriglobales bacterium]|nr:LutB/LldF family L-lactate oxidation iron-sulfur protein [Terriglobales bacterium]